MLTLHAGPHADASATPNAEPAAGAAEEWSRVWFNLSARAWRSLALVPAAPELSALALAERLAECARAYQSDAVRVVDARGAEPGEVAALAAAVAEQSAGHERVLLVLASPLVRAAAIPLARAAEAALLVVPLGMTGVRDARQTVAAVGHTHFVGSVTMRERAADERAADERASSARTFRGR